jgi:hypothetical protein
LPRERELQHRRERDRYDHHETQRHRQRNAARIEKVAREGLFDLRRGAETYVTGAVVRFASAGTSTTKSIISNVVRRRAWRKDRHRRQVACLLRRTGLAHVFGAGRCFL